MKKTLTLLLCLMAVTTTRAQLTLQKYDFPNLNHGKGNIGSFFGMNSKTYFFASDNAIGPIGPLWEMSSSSAPVKKHTNILLDYYAFPCQVNGISYFNALEPILYQHFLARYDGINPPQIIIDTSIKRALSNPTFLIELHGKLYFSTFNSYDGVLWCYDPVTESLKELNSGTAQKATFLTAFNNKLLFTGTDGTSDGVYQYDPATDQTQAIAGVSFFGGNSFPCMYTVYNSKVYFFANTKNDGNCLFEYDGNNQPNKLKSFASLPINMPGMPYIPPYNNRAYMTVFKGNLYFTASTGIQNDYRLVRYNLATGNVDDISSASHTNVATPNDLVTYAGALYYIDNSNNLSIYRYDGINPPVDIQSLSLPYQFTNPTRLTESFGSLYFCAEPKDNINVDHLFVLTDAKAEKIEQTHAVETLYISPNPATATANLILTQHQPDDLSVTLTNMNGKLVYTTGFRHYTAAQHQIQLPMQHLAIGIYTCTVSNADGLILSRIIEKQ